MMQSLDPAAPLIHAATGEGSAPDTRRLARLISAHTPYDGSFALRVPGVQAVRWSRPHPQLVQAVQRPALCIVAQGAKRVLLGTEVFEYDPERMIVFSLTLPLAAQITRASRVEPFLAVRLDLDPPQIAELAARVYPHGLPPGPQRGVYVGAASGGIVEAATRLVALMADAGEAELLGPLVIEEILIRLLRSPLGGRVAQIGRADSSVSRIAQAVEWLRANFAQPVNVDELAALVHMSVSSFHQHFKAVTAMSPVQFQKVLRLQEARQLMLARMLDVGTASRQVGYLSVSQFSREYRRFFGHAPSKDLAQLREQGGAVAEAAP